MPEYEYPKLSPKWDFWIMTMNIERELGKKPEYISGSDVTVAIAFKEPLTDDEKGKLDAIMSDEKVGLHPDYMDIVDYVRAKQTHTIFEIKDIWDYRNIIERVVGKRVKWFFILPALPDGTHVMQLWIEGKLSPEEIKKVKEAYASLISEEQP